MKYAARSQVDANSENEELKKINWDDYNYPVCLKIFHYDPAEVPQHLKRKVTLLRINHIVIIIALLWNFINNIVNAAQGVNLGGIRIAISIFIFFLWLPASFYIFIIPYMAYMKKESKVWVFYVLSLVAVIWFFIWSIADFADANGWVMVSNNSNNGRGAATFFSVITALLMLGISILSIVNLVLFYRRPRDE